MDLFFIFHSTKTWYIHCRSKLCNSNPIQNWNTLNNNFAKNFAWNNFLGCRKSTNFTETRFRAFIKTENPPNLIGVKINFLKTTKNHFVIAAVMDLVTGFRWRHWRRVNMGWRIWRWVSSHTTSWSTIHIKYGKCRPKYQWKSVFHYCYAYSKCSSCF